MKQELLEAVKGFNTVSREIIECEDCIDSVIADKRPRKQKSKTPGDLKKQLQESFLSPPTAFSSSWLDRLQQ